MTDDVLSWYQDIYDDKDYKMGISRKKIATYYLTEVPRGTLLDVGCGRGEMLAIAKNHGFEPAGLEASEKMADGKLVHYGTAQDIPFKDNAFDVVTMFDVIEHIPEADVIEVLYELKRVARKHILITASNLVSWHKGKDLHITKKPYDEWDQLFNIIFDGKATWRKHPSSRVSELWSIELE